jgi:predicted RecB family nuclease
MKLYLLNLKAGDFMNKFTVLCAAILALFLSCTNGEGDKSAGELKPLPVQEQKMREQTEPVTFDSIVGRWYLMYPESLGYEMQFYKNYRALVVLYLQNHALLFKGVYTLLEEENRVRINIYEMKRSESVTALNKGSGFTEAKSSYFLFQCGTTGQKQERRLVVRPLEIIIDGNDSDGFFEPVLRLKKRQG